MILDDLTVSVMSGLVGVVAGVLFISETLIRRDDGPGRVWAFAYLCGMSTTISYIIWSSGGESFAVIAVGNALFAFTTGFLWLGARRFNDRSLLWPGVLVASIGVVVASAVLLEGPDAGYWAGSVVLFAALVFFAIAACYESLRSPMVRVSSAWTLSLVFALEAVYFLTRIIFYIAWGVDSPFFQAYFGTVATSILVMTLTITGLVVTSVLRATRLQVRGYAWLSADGVASDGILLGPTFVGAMRDIAERARWRSELISVISIRVDDVTELSRAFGADLGSDLVNVTRQGVRRFAPSTSVVGEDGEAGLLICARPETAAEARRYAATVYRGLLDAFATVAPDVMPIVGVGVALSSDFGYDPRGMIRAARDAAKRAATSAEASVLFAAPATIPHTSG
ncbi:hypothetical protein FHX48_001320 [Microbacterium halimionae]|uniref:GGDEF domain-containing protein n=1 Tax=Microbacterium halimionae TaxID=1526413 RepID=A0A7W3JNS3_9MICO|nr:diguanylate cyclase [Microbacterium halimionae]MBA8816247.1 hypothetical protein [Microbacterium halimionae]NII96449.1 hypothetical protein [Microbacterium halimionae]